eukprot:TRINITY_DN15133_c0_g1_i1.p1 TRINITY_DN15133_c0_g1~~TRINITY_DN15133_c0_g1_i1.p1  ORF type:complete len:1039 (+),score=260.77 TRINITY_DN15133_c0_g1_i1:108-3224(+)
MGKKPKRLTPAEELALAEEERRAVHDAYLNMYKELHSPRPTKSFLPLGVRLRSEFPLPPMNCRTLRPRSTHRRLPLNQTQRRAILSAVRTATSGEGHCEAKCAGDIFHLLGADAKSQQEHQNKAGVKVINDCTAKLVSVWWSKAGNIIDELVDNLVFSPAIGNPRLAIAELACRIHEGVAGPGTPRGSEGVIEVLLQTLLTMEGPDIDRLLCWSDAPPPWEDDTGVAEEWARYRKQNRPHGARNRTLFREVALACNALGGVGDPSSYKRWAKTVVALDGMSARRVPLLKHECPDLFKALWGLSQAQIDMLSSLKYGMYLAWPCPGCFSRTEKDALRSASARGPLFLVHLRNCGVAFSTEVISQYPDEHGYFVPPFAVCEVIAVEQDNEDEEGGPPRIVLDYYAESTFSSMERDSVRFQAASDLRFAEKMLTDLQADAEGGEAKEGGIPIGWFGRRGDDDGDIDESQLISEQNIQKVAALANAQAGPCPGKAEVDVLTENEAVKKGLVPGQEDDLLRLGQLLAQEYNNKRGDLIDELLQNCKSPQPAALRGVDGIQRLAVLAEALRQKPSVQQHLSGLNLAELLVLWLYTAHGTDIDEVFGFQVPPRDQDGWASYVEDYQTESWDPAKRKRNGAVFCDVNWTMRQLGSDNVEDSDLTKQLSKWSKFAAVLLALTSRPIQVGGATGATLFRGFGGQAEAGYRAQRSKQPGETIHWPAFSSCALDREVSVSYIDGSAANATARPGKAFMFHVNKGTAGIPLWGISQYPDEKEQLLPPLSTFSVHSVHDDEELRTAYRKGLSKQLQRDARPAAEVEQKCGEVEACVLTLNFTGCLGEVEIRPFCQRVLRDTKRATRRLQRALQAVKCRERRSGLARARDRLQEASEALLDDQEPFHRLFQLQAAETPTVVRDVVEALRVAVNPTGSPEAPARVRDTLIKIASGVGCRPPEQPKDRTGTPDSLIQRLTELTTAVLRANTIPEMTTIKFQLQQFHRNPDTRPDSLRAMCREDILEGVQDIVVWVKAYWALATALIASVREQAKS